MAEPSPSLGSRFEEALIYASQLHSKQTRKGKTTPYIAHLMSVTALVLEAGGDEDEAIAALLHDAVEDQGGTKTLDEIRERFGTRVAKIIDGCTDSYTYPKPPWRQRKEEYIANMMNASQEVRRVSLADKLHNARTLLRELRNSGNEVWGKFTGGKKGTLWYYSTLFKVFDTGERDWMLEELNRTLKEIEYMSEENMPIDEEVHQFLLKHLDTILNNDIEAYHNTTSDDLTLYEWWVTPHRIDGLPFHDFMMGENIRRGAVFGSEAEEKTEGWEPTTRFDLANLKIQRYGDTAIASYTLLISTGLPEGVKLASHNESRVLVKLDGKWQVVHVHKSPTWPAPHVQQG